MKASIYKFLILSCTLVAMGCSQEWRETDSGATADDVAAQLNDAISTGASAESADITVLKDDKNTTIFFGQAGDAGFDHVGELLTFLDFHFINSSDIYTTDTITKARVFFLDTPSADANADRKAVLILALALKDGTFKYFTYKGTVSIQGGEYVADLAANDGTKLTLRSWDMANSQDLQTNIQLSVFDQDGKVGTISTLQGFAQQ